MPVRRIDSRSICREKAMKVSALIMISALLTTAQSTGQGRVLFSMRDWNCPDVGVVDLIEDETTGKRYWHVIGCDGSTGLYPDQEIIGGEPSPYSSTGHVVQRPLTPRPSPEPSGNFWSILRQGASITTPNRVIGVRLIEATGGREHWARTFIDPAEKIYYEGLRWHEQNPLMVRERFRNLDLSPGMREEMSWVTTTAPTFVLLPDGSNAAEGVKPHHQGNGEGAGDADRPVDVHRKESHKPFKRSRHGLSEVYRCRPADPAGGRCSGANLCGV